jgi:hypothetical protein
MPRTLAKSPTKDKPNRYLAVFVRRRARGVRCPARARRARPGAGLAPACFRRRQAALLSNSRCARVRRCDLQRSRRTAGCLRPFGSSSVLPIIASSICRRTRLPPSARRFGCSSRAGASRSRTSSPCSRCPARSLRASRPSRDASHRKPAAHGRISNGASDPTSRAAWLPPATWRTSFRRSSFGSTEAPGEWLSEARARGDLYAETTARLYLAPAQLAADRPAEAERLATLTLQSWNQRPPPFQEFYRLRLLAYIRLYQSLPDAALELAAAAERVLCNAQLQHFPLAILEIRVLTARIRVRLALQHASDMPGHLLACERDLQRLERLGRPDASGYAALVRASLELLQGQPGRAREELVAARRCFEQRQMALAAV